MSDIALLLGPIAFRGFEVPEQIRFGGQQRLAVHDLTGGGRVVDVLGPVETDVAFAGVISGGDAAARALELDALRAAGLPLPLYWDAFFYLVVIEAFQADYCTPSWIPYRINCRVLQSTVGLAVGAAGSLLTAVQSDLGFATALAAPSGLALGPAAASVAAPGATSFGTAANVGAQTSLGSALDGIGAAARSAGTVIEGLGGGNNLLGAGSAAAAIANLNGVVGAAGSLGALTLAGSYLSRASGNLADASS